MWRSSTAEYSWSVMPLSHSSAPRPFARRRPSSCRLVEQRHLLPFDNSPCVTRRRAFQKLTKPERAVMSMGPTQYGKKLLADVDRIFRTRLPVFRQVTMFEMHKERTGVSGIPHPLPYTRLITVFNDDDFRSPAILSESIQDLTLVAFHIDLYEIWSYLQNATQLVEPAAGYLHAGPVRLLNNVVEFGLRLVCKLHLPIARGERRVHADHVIAMIQADVFRKRGKGPRMRLDAHHERFFDFRSDQRIGANVRAHIDEHAFETLHKRSDKMHVVEIVGAHGIDQSRYAAGALDAECRLGERQVTREIVQQSAHLPLQVPIHAVDRAYAIRMRDLLKAG